MNALAREFRDRAKDRRLRDRHQDLSGQGECIRVVRQAHASADRRQRRRTRDDLFANHPSMSKSDIADTMKLRDAVVGFFGWGEPA